MSLERNSSGRGENITPKRLRLALEATLKLSVKEVKVQGEENIKQIPKDAKVIIATTHISDIDMPIVAATLAKYFNIAIANMSVHHSFHAEASTNIGIRIAGRNNFIPIDYKKVTDGKRASSFNPDNFEPMKAALEDGKAVVVAAHNPTKEWSLPKGGYGVSYLSDIAGDNVVILPVAVNLESEGAVGMFEDQVKTVLKRPVANIQIGEPITLEKIPGIEDFSSIMHRRRNGEALTPEDRERFSELSDALRVQSDTVMQKLAHYVPEEKRGVYQGKSE
jgi:hypothetical protein